MARFTVFSQSGTEARYTGTPVYHGSFLAPAYLEFREIASPTLIPWQIGDYVDYHRTGYRYKLYSVPYPTKQAARNAAGDSFVYRDVQFFCATKDLEIAPFRDLVISDNTIHFTTLPDVSTYEDVFGIARRIQANMDAFYGEGSWNIRVYDTSDAEIRALLLETKQFSVSNGTCLDALSQIYSDWKGIGWVYSVENGVNTITIGRPNIQDSGNTTSVFAYGIGNGIKVLKKEQSGKNDFATRIYAYGSTRNLIARYYNNITPPIKDAQSVYIPNLMLPLANWGETAGQKDARKAYIDADAATVAKYGLRPKTIYFDGSGDYEEIYPSVEGMTIGEIRAAMGASDEYRPTIGADSDRVDEVVAAVNPPDDGVAGESDGKKYVQIIRLGGISQSVSSQSPPGAPSGRITLGVLTGTGNITSTGKLLVTPDISGTIESSAQLGGLTMSIWLEIDGAKRGEREVTITQDGSNRFALSAVPFSVTTKEAGSVVMKGAINFTPTNQSAGVNLTANITVKTCSIEVESTPNDAFEVTVRQLGFDISKQQSAVSDGLCTISMKTGWCAGREFTVKKCEYIENQDQWKLTVTRKYDESVGQYFPNNVYVIAPGDRFVLTDLTMPEIYVAAAQRRLYDRATAVLAGLCKPHIVYEPEIDAKVLARSPERILEGMYMPITDADIVDDITDWVLIDSIEIDEGADAIPTYRITLQDEKHDGFLSRITREAGRNTRAINEIVITDHRRDAEGPVPDASPLLLPIVRVSASAPVIAYEGGAPVNDVLLTCETQNINSPEYQWSFYDPSTDTWADIPGANGQTYKVDPASGIYFLDGRLVEEFRVVINGENQLSASVQIAKMITGEQIVYRLDLTNENASINADAGWNILPGAVRPTCSAKLYYGASVVSGVTYSISTSAQGVSIDASTGVLTFANNFNFSGTGVEIAVMATKDDVTAIAIMTVTKVVPGADGADAVSYWLVLSADKVSVDPNLPTISPQPGSVTATAMKQVGDSVPVEASECTIKYRFDDGQESVYRGAVDVDIDKQALTFILYLGTTILDTESVPILYNGLNGSDGKSAFKSIVFRRSETKPNKPGSNSGSYSNPVPTGWSDGIPAPTGSQTTDTRVWVTSRIFTADALPPQQSEWSPVQPLTDTSDIDFEFSAVKENPGTPETSPSNWHGSATDSDIWMAVRKGENGVWGAWEVTKIKGEKGDPGVSVVAQYSADGATNWHPTFVAGDLYMRTSSDGGQTWGAAIRIVGEDGAPGTDGNPGDYTDYSFAYSPNLTSSQSDGCPTDTGTDGSEGGKITSWSDAPPAAVAGQYLWMRVIGMTYDPENPSADAAGFVHGTPSYARIGGEKGKDGIDGENGKKGKILRGRSKWYNTGYGNDPTVPYQGEQDETGEYIDIVLYGGQTYLCLVGGSNATASDPATNTYGCWQLMNNFQFIATEAIYAERIKSLQAQIDDLIVKRLETDPEASGKTSINGGNVSVSDSSGSPRINIHGTPMTDTGAGSGITRSLSAKTGTCTSEEAQIELEILSQYNSSQRIAITNSNNKVTVPGFSLSVEKTASMLNPNLGQVSIFVAFVSEEEGSKPIYSVEIGVDGDSGTIPIPGRTTTLAVGTWGLKAFIGFINEEGKAGRFSATITPNQSTLTVAIQSADALSELASDGFRSVWSGEGFKATSVGAKVIQSGNEYAALAGEGGLKRVKLVTSYPTTEEEGVLYIKVS